MWGRRFEAISAAHGSDQMDIFSITAVNDLPKKSFFRTELPSRRSAFGYRSWKHRVFYGDWTTNEAQLCARGGRRKGTIPRLPLERRQKGISATKRRIRAEFDHGMRGHCGSAVGIYAGCKDPHKFQGFLYLLSFPQRTTMARPDQTVYLRDVVPRIGFLNSWERHRHRKAHWFVELFAEAVSP